MGGAAVSGSASGAGFSCALLLRVERQLPLMLRRQLLLLAARPPSGVAFVPGSSGRRSRTKESSR